MVTHCIVDALQTVSPKLALRLDGAVLAIPGLVTTVLAQPEPIA